MNRAGTRSRAGFVVALAAATALAVLAILDPFRLFGFNARSGACAGEGLAVGWLLALRQESGRLREPHGAALVEAILRFAATSAVVALPLAVGLYVVVARVLD